MSDDFAGDNFTKWVLIVTASVVVLVGGWLAATLTSLNTRLGVMESQLTGLTLTVGKIADDSEDAARERNDMRERIIKLEYRAERQDKTRTD